ncbi:MAG TPA: S49 family peptidase [Geminicoccaceae bacterium]
MGMRSYSRAAITQRLFNTPLQVLPETASIVLGAVGQRFDVAQLFLAAEGRTLGRAELAAKADGALIEIEAKAGTDQVAPKSAAGELMRIVEGVAFIEIRGELVAENGIGPASGFTGYDGIRAQVLAGDADSDVRGFVLDIDSPGGEVAGLYELTRVLMARRGTKPMRAVIRACGCSAAYAIAACADEVTLHQLGIAGSVGTIAMHADFSGQLEQEGIKVTLIMAGAHKADGNPFEPLPVEVRDRIAALVTTANDQFIGHVSTARGLSEADVRAQEAQIYQGEEAVAVGLVDKVMSWADSIDEFTVQMNEGVGGGSEGRAARPAPGARSRQETNMNTDKNAPAGDAQPEFNQATQTAAVQAAVTSERERITQLASLDAESTLSDGLTAAISAGTSAGDFAIQLQTASREKQTAALAAARGDSVAGDKLPEQRTDAAGTGGGKPNRGAAVVERLRGHHKGLPAKA